MTGDEQGQENKITTKALNGGYDDSLSKPLNDQLVFSVSFSVASVNSGTLLQSMTRQGEKDGPVI